MKYTILYMVAYKAIIEIGQQDIFLIVNMASKLIFLNPSVLVVFIVLT